MTRFLLVVFDGLRPDAIEAEATPNLRRFAAMGTRFAAARSVFPSETRVCSASIATGCLPRRHGVVANRIADPADPARSIDTGSKAALEAWEAAMGAPVVQAPTLAEHLAAQGRRFAVLSSGSTGQSHVLNPRADILGQVTLSAHGPAACSAAGRALLARLAPPPDDAPARAEWIAEAFRAHLLPDPPDATILWLCEPDTSGHYAGLGTPDQRAALRRVDAAFGRILDDWQAGPHRDTLQVMVASDHGQATITGQVGVAGALARHGGFADCTVLAGSSGGVMVPGGDAARIAEMAEWLTRQDWAGCVFAADGADLPPGVLPRSVLMAEHERAAPVLFTLRAGPDLSPLGLPGNTLHDGKLPLGGGTHGGLSAAELRTVLMLAGSRVRRGIVTEWPAGLPDIAPTALALLDADGAAGMDGRVLAEALDGGSPPAMAAAPESWEAAGHGYAQRVARRRLGRQVYLDAGMRLETT